MMKKFLLTGLSLLLVGILVACGNGNNNNDNGNGEEEAAEEAVVADPAMHQITEEEAKEIALEAVQGEVTGVTQGEVTDGDLTLVVYIVSIETEEGTSKDVKVAMATGDVMEIVEN